MFKKKTCSKADAAFVSSLNAIFTFFFAKLSNILYRLIEDMQTGRMLHWPLSHTRKVLAIEKL